MPAQAHVQCRRPEHAQNIHQRPPPGFPEAVHMCKHGPADAGAVRRGVEMFGDLKAIQLAELAMELSQVCVI